MRFVHVGDETGRWRWFTYQDGPFRVHLRMVTASEFQQVARQYKLTTDNASVGKLTAYVAQHWFDDFTGAEDQDGNPIDNTPEMRQAILDDPDVSRWVIELLTNSANWRDEGNGDSGSGS